MNNDTYFNNLKLLKLTMRKKIDFFSGDIQ